ncbi:hypothetical protein CRUP_012241, partial [Coryphaenoides rupestris]
DFPFQLTEFIIGVFLQVLGLPFLAVAQVSLFSKVMMVFSYERLVPPPAVQHAADDIPKLWVERGEKPAERWSVPPLAGHKALEPSS